MAEFSTSTVVPYPREVVERWHARPGALTRLTPEFSMAIETEPHPPLAPGAKAQMQVSVPGSYGVVRVPFVTEHTEPPAPDTFAETLVRGPMKTWEHTHTFETVKSPTADSPDGFCRITDRVEYSVAPGGFPGAAEFDEAALEPTLRAAFEGRHDRLLDELAYDAELAAFGGPKKILVAGSSGLVGQQVVAMLQTAGHEVRRLIRSTPRRENEVRWNPDLGLLDRGAVAWADVVVHLGGASIGRRFTAEGKRRILDSRVDSTKLLALTIGDLPASERPEAFVCASAVGYYGSDRDDEQLTESAARGEGFLAEVCEAWEREAAQVEQYGVRRVSIRTGVVMSTLGGVLRLQLPLFLLGFGGRVGSGEQWLAWVSLDDITRIYARAVMDPQLSGPVNAVAPDVVRQADFARTLAGMLSRPAALPLPTLAPRLVLGREAAAELAVADQRVVPAALAAAGYEFAHPSLESALAATLGIRRDTEAPAEQPAQAPAGQAPVEQAAPAS